MLVFTIWRDSKQLASYQYFQEDCTPDNMDSWLDNWIYDFNPTLVTIWANGHVIGNWLRGEGWGFISYVDFNGPNNTILVNWGQEA